MIAYVYTTRTITEWRTHLREKMNRLDGQALSRAVDSLLNYETVKYFGAEAREEARYAQATRAYADAAVKSENSLGLLNIAQAVVVNLLNRRPDLKLVPPSSLRLDLTQPVLASTVTPSRAGRGPGRRGEIWRSTETGGVSWWTQRAKTGVVAPGFTRENLTRPAAEDPRAQGGVFDRVLGVLTELVELA